jgi:hypothetical protein
MGLNQTNTFTFNRYAVKPGRQLGSHSEKLKQGEMVARQDAPSCIATDLFFSALHFMASSDS